MSPVSAFPTQPCEEQRPPSIEVQKQTLLDYLTAFGLANLLTQEEKLQFIEVAQAFRLNPFKREIHIAVYGEGEYRRMSIVVGYQVYLDRAERTGQLDGWRAWVEGQGEDMKALVEIHRKDWHSPFVHEVYWKEAVQRKRDGTPTSFWTKMPRFQLKKVAVSQGFRLAFPSELGGLPYDAAELPDAESLTPASSAPASAFSPNAVEQEAPVVPVNPRPITIGTPVSVLTAPEPTMAQSMPSLKPEPVTIRLSGRQDPYPEEDHEALLNRLDAYLDDNAEAFTEKHADWIMEKARKSQDREGILKMLSYSMKVVKNSSAVASATV